MILLLYLHHQQVILLWGAWDADEFVEAVGRKEGARW